MAVWRLGRPVAGPVEAWGGLWRPVVIYENCGGLWRPAVIGEACSDPWWPGVLAWCGGLE